MCLYIASCFQSIFVKHIMLENFKDFIPNIHREGHTIRFIFLAITLLLFLLSQSLGLIGVALTIFCILFFRDPDRVTPIGEDLIISPGDGLVQKISFAKPPRELEMPNKEMTKISIFLSVFDVHVNRIPVEGTVTVLKYHPGKFFNASLDKASEYNERQSILITTNEGLEIPVVQIAGLIARRIVCTLQEGQKVKAGERLGIIKFGSRVDIYLPEGILPQVIEGQRIIGGETIIASTKSKWQRREGEVR